MRAGRALLVLGTTTALLAGGGMLAYAGWSSTTDSATFTVPAGRLPTVAQPTVLLPVAADGIVVLPRIAWRPAPSAPGPDVHGYRVTRHAGPDAAVVCTVPATKRPACLDREAPPGVPLAYTVAATRGTFWKGRDSAPSRPVTVPGIPVTATASSSPSASAAPSAAAVSPTVEPTPDTSTSPSASPTTSPSTDAPAVGETASVPTPVTSDAPPPALESAPPTVAADPSAPVSP